MRICIFGASGACGVQLIEEALTVMPSCTIVAYVRSPEKFSEELRGNPSLIIVKGQLDDEESLAKALEGVDVVLSALGPSTNPTKAPFYPSGTPLALAYARIIRLMKVHGVQRFIALGATSMTDSNDKFSLQFCALVTGVATVAHNAYKDMVAIGKTIRTDAADLDWTIVRVPLLNNDKSREVIAGYVGDGKTTTTLSRAGFAAFVINEIHSTTPLWLKKAPLVCSA